MNDVNPSILKNLTNREVFMVYSRFKKHQGKIKDIIKNKMVPVKANTPFGPALVMRPATPEEIEKLQNSEYMKAVDGIVEKLTDFSELIKDVDPEVVEIMQEFE